ncbi:MAG: hypothetical protein KDJ20_07925 [Hyphomicrobiales bacterium]|nr:hypothetical protein [Hyphomicrobiales bacterium]MCC2108197.1 hypothetical protein [Hyphomicrobiales bacterium]MCC2111738.1 hypothetical protein [Hyphomicrobiales bacterium]
MNVFFDNCTPPRLASALDGFISADGHRAFHIKDVPGLPNGRSSTDLEWIDHLRRDQKLWIFVSGDGRVLKNPAERAALRAAGLHGIILAPAFLKTPVHQQASHLIWRWPELETLVSSIAAPAMFELPIGRSAKPRSLPL